jgi:hypothetical protein
VSLSPVSFFLSAAYRISPSQILILCDFLPGFADRLWYSEDNKNLAVKMKNFINQISSVVRGGLCQPVRVEAWADGVSDFSKRPMVLTSSSIRTADVVRWDRLGEYAHAQERGEERGVLRGWAPGAGRSYTATTQSNKEIINLVSETTTKGWTCDLQDVQGLSSSKSDLSSHSTMESFATQNCLGLLDQPSAEAVAKNIHWNEVRIHDLEGPDHFCRYDWDGRVFLVNSGGSHHFAAAHQMAREIDQAVPLIGKLKTYGFNQQSVASLRQKFEVFAVPSDPVQKNDFWEAMKEAGAAYSFFPLPTQMGSNQLEAVLLPRENTQSMKVAKILSTAGFWNVGQTLSELSMGAHRHFRSTLPLFPLPPSIPGVRGKAPRPMPGQSPELDKSFTSHRSPRPF